MPDWARQFRVRRAAALMRRGAVVAYPTEAVWGLGCDPYDPDAVARLLALKARPVHKGLILLAAGMDQLSPWLADLASDQRARLQASWPGPVTWLVPAGEHTPFWIRGRFDTVALRVSDHPVAAGLSRAFGGPIVSTSANPAGLSPARDRCKVRQYFGESIDATLPGHTGGRASPSTIRDLRTGRTLRGA